MLNIKTNQQINYVVFEDAVSSSVEAKDSISYIVKDSLVTFLREGIFYRLEELSGITVNNSIVDSQTIISQLASIFSCDCCCGSGGGNSRNIIYLGENDELPLGGQLDDLAIVTTDGTSAGEQLLIYRFDGFLWELFSFKPNLAAQRLPGTSDSSLNYSADTANVLQKILFDKEYFRVTAKANSLPQISVNSYGFPFIYENGKDYLANVTFTLDRDETLVKDIVAYPSLSVNGVTDNDGYLEFKSLEITNSELETVSISSRIKDIKINNIEFGSYGMLALYGDFEKCTLENVQNIHTYHSYNSFYNYAKLETTLNNVSFNLQGEGFRIMLGREDLEIYLTMNNVSGIKHFMLPYCKLKSIDIANFDSSNLMTVALSGTNFETQEMLDQLLLIFLGNEATGMPTGGNVDIYDINFTPSQNILSQFEARGITVRLG